jgi:ribosome maturation protein SDO1
MSAAHQHQDAQERHTNIAIVRLRKGGKKFEVAAYPNKVLSWRQGIEKDLDEVLQVATVFENVSRGSHAKKDDLAKVFGTDDVVECCKLILAKGEVQIGEKERELEYSSKFRDIATMVASRCVNSQTGWPFTVATIETAMRDTIHFAVNPNKPTKQQATEVIERLKEYMPIARARIHVKVTAKAISKEQILKVAGDKSEVTASGDGWVEILANPSHFRELEQLAKSVEGNVVILQFSEISASKDVDLDEVAHLTLSEQPSDEKKSQSDGKEVAKDGTASSSTATSSKAGGLRCTSCDVGFGEDRQAQRAHYKTEFHTFNVKLKAVGLPTVSFPEFENMSEQDRHAVLFDWKS